MPNAARQFDKQAPRPVIDHKAYRERRFKSRTWPEPFADSAPTGYDIHTSLGGRDPFSLWEKQLS